MTIKSKKHSRIVCKITIMVMFLISILPVAALACSEIWIKDHQKVDTLVSARTFDFMSGEGFMQFKPAGVAGQAQYTLPSGTPLKWTSKYATLVFKTTIDKGKTVADGKFAADVDGMNEAGLKIGTYFLESSIFSTDHSDVMIDIASLSQYFLDNFGTVSEVVKDIRLNEYSVIALPVNGLDIKLHLFLHDAKGESAIIEFINGTVNVIENPSVPVITNTAYEESVSLLQSYVEFGGTKYIPGSYESMDRFVRAAFYHKHLKSPESAKQAVNYGFAAIQTVSVSPRFPRGCTEWTIVSDINEGKMYVRTLNNPNIISINLAKLAASQKNVVSRIDMLRTDLQGDITNLF